MLKNFRAMKTFKNILSGLIAMVVYGFIAFMGWMAFVGFITLLYGQPC